MNNPDGLQLVSNIRQGVCTAAQVMAQAYDRIDAADGQVGAFASTLGRAEALDLCSAPAYTAAPLAGLPVAVKDIFDTAALPTAYGSAIYAGFQPAGDAAIVASVRRAGGVVMGKTVTCEFAYMAPTATRNPHDPRRTAGGSSSGSAAAVAAGMVPFAIGTQTGGSTIRPAAYCGIAGYKPTFGLLPAPGMKCFSWSLDTVGLFAQSVDDVAWFAAQLSGRNLAVSQASALAHGRTLVVGVPLAYPWESLSANARSALERACQALAAHGVSVRHIALPAWMDALTGAHAHVQEYEASQSLAFEFDQHRAHLSPMLADFLTRARTVSAAQYDAARACVAHASQHLAQLFDGVDVLLTPSAPDEAPLGFTSTGSPSFNRVWTLLGTPCVNVPGLFGSSACPMGVQIIAAPWQDALCLSAASLLQAALAAMPGLSHLPGMPTTINLHEQA